MDTGAPPKTLKPPHADPSETRLREILRRCSPETVNAAILFRKTRNPELLSTIVVGVLVRFIEPECRTRLLQGHRDLRIVEDLGIDSLLLIEIVLVLEEVFAIKISNDELQDLSTVNDVHNFLQEQSRSIA